MLNLKKFRCTVCNYVYDEKKEEKKFSDLPFEWVCPVCGAPKTAFVILTEKPLEQTKKFRTVVDLSLHTANGRNKNIVAFVHQLKNVTTKNLYWQAGIRYYPRRACRQYGLSG